MTITDILTGITAIAALIIALSERRKKQADYASIISNASISLISPLESKVAMQARLIAEMQMKSQLLCEQVAVQEIRMTIQNTKLEKQALLIEELQQENEKLKARIRRLVHQVHSLGSVPVDL